MSATATLTRPASQTLLTPEQIAQYHSEGYVIYNRPVLPEDKFTGLKDYFEEILADLPENERPEAMDVPHFMHPKLLEWAFDDAILDIVEPITGPDIVLYSSHFICKPKGNGKRVPWHEDSAYWKGKITPMEICTVWLAIDPSTRENGCMKVIPRTHVEGQKGYSEYEPVNPEQNVFSSEIKASNRDDSKQVYIELDANECSLHDARVMHASEPNTSAIRRCGWTMRFASSAVQFSQEKFDGTHVIYLARGRDRGGNVYADPTRSYPEVLEKRGFSGRYKNSH